MWTRKQYLAGEVSHHDYYSQFITPETRRVVAQTFGTDNLVREYAKDRHLNGLSIRRWDALSFHDTAQGFQVHLPYNREAFALADSYGMTRACAVCIAKTAAVLVVLAARGDN